ncbi:YitT family protein [Aquibacillus kalidii]|uniref:YitT family protein n=1 Tax=Aquibacillus kalidii TaxID=2762597 RepID=UPI0016495574|nr:YitT family protein [Aquibacillus kalidii]
MKKILMIFLGIIITSCGVIVLKHSQIVTGGTAGLALNLSYIFHSPFSILFFIINIPFYIFSVLRMGWKFTLSTMASVSVLSLITSLDQWIPTFTIASWLGAIIGGAFIGIGLSILFANGSSLGGANILALFLHKRYNLNPGITNFAFDFLVVLTSMYSVGLFRGVSSILSIAITSVVISYFKNKISGKQEKPARVKSQKVQQKVAVSQ